MRDYITQKIQFTAGTNKSHMIYALIVRCLMGIRKCPLLCWQISIAESVDGVQEVISELLRQIKCHCVASQVVSEKRSTLRGVKRVLKKKIYRSKSDTMWHYMTILDTITLYSTLCDTNRHHVTLCNAVWHYVTLYNTKHDTDGH